MSEHISNDKKRKNIDELKFDNKINFRLISNFENQIKKYKKEIEENTKLIQSQCDHDFERVIEPHERTYYSCKKCDYDTRINKIIY
tara:strand:- start:283 stop:540 length:258 start_codon:yes stop_codon:yes gene_type:complete